MHFACMSFKIDIGAMQALCAVVDHGGVTRAADRLSLTQSAVSHKIKRLEEHLGRTLLSRHPGSKILTEDGEKLLAYARRILAIHDEALLTLSSSSIAGHIRLGITEDMTGDGLVRILRRFAVRHPDVSVHTHVRQSLVLEAEVGAGEIDLALFQLFRQRLQPRDIALFEDRIRWVRSPNLQVSQSRPLPFVAFDDQCFLKRWAMREDRAAGFVTVLTCASTAGVVAAVEAGLGVALLNSRHVTAEMQDASDLCDDSPPSTVYIARVGQKSRTEAVAALAREVKAEMHAS